jgi:hypothetical protein
LLVACGPGAARYTRVPTTLAGPTVVPPMPTDPSDPLARVVFCLNYDLRTFDDTWTWLEDTVPEGPERDRALAVASLLGVSELDRLDLLEPGLAAFDRAIVAFPDDPRLPLWRAFLAFRLARASGDAEAVAQAYQGLRDGATTYSDFTLFGLTLSVAGDPDASPALLEEALAAYDRIFSEADQHQFSSDPVDRARGPRVFGDLSTALYNIPGTNALRGDIAARLGNTELAQRSYYTAIHSNLGHRWLWREEVERRLADVEGLSRRLAARPAEDHMLGARYVGALGTSERVTDPWLQGRLGNGSCTLCHTALSTYDAGREAAPVGWVHVRYRRPAAVEAAMPLFFVLPDAEEGSRPESFLLSVVQAPGLPAFTPDEPFSDAWIPAPPGSWFVAGQITRGGVPTHSTYTARELGMPRFIEVREGEVADITDAVLEWGPPR